MPLLPNAQSCTGYSSTSLYRPENCPEEYYTLIQNCLSHVASDRPTFADLTALLGAYSNEEFRLEEVERNELEDTIRCTTTNLSPVEEVPESWTLVTNNNTGEYSNDTQGSEEDWCQETDIDYQINGGACAAGGRKGSIVTAGSSQDSLTTSMHASRISLVWPQIILWKALDVHVLILHCVQLAHHLFMHTINVKTCTLNSVNLIANA